MICQRCGRENPDGFRFCGSCGASLAPEGAETRKTVTILFSDVTGSTSLGERLDSESIRGVMSRYFGMARTVLDRHGGTVEKFIGDAVMAVFGVPNVHEDDALRAVRAAVELRFGLEQLNDELERIWGARIQTRTGINTGDVLAGDPSGGQSFVSGDAVNVAARLEQAAQPGEILIGEETLRLVRDAVLVESVEPLSLKGKADPVPAFRLFDVLHGAPAFIRRLDSPMLGRDAELQTILDAFARAKDQPGCELLTLHGIAGVGKSRLIRELSTVLRNGARILEGHCLPYGEGITFWPVAEIVKQATGMTEADTADEAEAKIGMVLSTGDDEEASRIRVAAAAAIGLRDAQGTIQETFWAVRRLLETLADDQPLVAVIDDIHWAEPTLLDLIEYVAGFSRGRAILLVCTARPELREEHADFGRSGTNIRLKPLGDAESEQLIENLLGDTSLPSEARAMIVESADGNPLFVEEMLRMLIDEGLLQRDDGHWIAEGDLSRVSVPRTIQALIAARLERLHEDERAVLQRASVVGRVFYWGAVTELSPEDARSKVGGNLQTLLRKELILPEPSPFAGEDAFRFSHILVHDAAYSSMPKRTRAVLHERFAAWLERLAGARLAEFEEIVGYHFERAYQYAAELGPIDEHGLGLASNAATRLAAAGRRAFARGDMSTAAGLIRRASRLLPEGNPARVVQLAELGAALTETGDWQEAEVVLREGIKEAQSLNDRSTEERAIIRLLYLQLHNGSPVSYRDVLPDVERAIEAFEELHDAKGLADAWKLRAQIEFWSGNCLRAIEAATRAAGHARRADDPPREAEALRARIDAQFWGPTPHDEVAASLNELARFASAAPKLKTTIAEMRSIIEGMRGNFGRAYEHAEQAKKFAKEFGLEVDYVAALNAAGEVAILEGDMARAERELVQSIGILRKIGDLGRLSSFGPWLAEVLDAQGRSDEALALTEEAEQVTTRGDTDAAIHWRRVRAKVLARRGRVDEALAFANEAADLARTNEDLNKRGKALMDLATVLRAASRAHDAIPVIREALETFKQKGNLVMMDAARAQLQELGASA